MTAATTLETRLAGTVEYHVGGEGDPVLLVHGLGGSSGNWVEVLPELVRRHRVIAVDLPGHAGSGPLARGATMDDFAAATAAVLEAESVQRAVVAGHSLGGLVALRLARSRPELVRGLLLVAPAGIATTSRVVEALVLRRRSGRVEPLRASATVGPTASGTGASSSGRGSSPIRSR